MKKLLLLLTITYSVSAHSQAPQLLKDILPGNPISFNGSVYTGPRGLINYNNQFYFIAPDTVVQVGIFVAAKEYNLWKSDGTSAGTQKVKDLNPIGNDEYYYTNGSSSIFQPLNIYDNQLFFSATDGTTFPQFGTNESQLCTSDGTSSGTLLFENLRTGSSCPGISYEPHDFISIDKKLLFKTNCPCSDDPTFRFWEYDSISKTTQKLGEDYIYYTWAGSTFDQRFQPFDLKNNFMLFPQPNYIKNPAPGQTVLSNPCFAAYNKQLGKLQKLKDSTHVVSIMDHVNSSQVVVALIPNIFDPNFAISLYSLNKNTLQLNPYYTFSTHALVPGIITKTEITFLEKLNSKLYFMVKSPLTTESGLWVTDGTAAGTYQIKSIQHDDMISQSKIMNNEIYFSSSNYLNMTDTLWKTDGTIAGTKFVAEFYGRSLKVFNSVVFDNKLYFSAASNANSGLNEELWETDGTAAGTKMYYDLFPGTQGSIPENLLAFNNKLFFSAYTPASGREIFYIQSISSIIAENNINDFSFNLFPNPTVNYITIEINTQNVNGNLKIINSIGQLIHMTTINSSKINVDVSTLNSGIYNVIIENNNHFATKKLQIIK